MIAFYLSRLTVGTVLNMKNWDERAENVNGFSRRSFYIMLIVGWMTFLLSGALNFGYYIVHPRYQSFIINNKVVKGRLLKNLKTMKVTKSDDR